MKQPKLYQIFSSTEDYLKKRAYMSTIFSTGVKYPKQKDHSAVVSEKEWEYIKQVMAAERKIHQSNTLF